MPNINNMWWSNSHLSNSYLSLHVYEFPFILNLYIILKNHKIFLRQNYIVFVTPTWTYRICLPLFFHVRYLKPTVDLRFLIFHCLPAFVDQVKLQCYYACDTNRPTQNQVFKSIKLPGAHICLPAFCVSFWCWIYQTNNMLFYGYPYVLWPQLHFLWQ